MDAKQRDAPEDEKDQNDKQDNVKDEEHGIEMSEDFDAEFQDGEEKEGKGDSEDESGDENDNLDEQMGDVAGAGEEQLDEKLWGEDGDNDEEKQVCGVLSFSQSVHSLTVHVGGHETVKLHVEMSK